jgi:hypothetical protein
MKLFNRFLAVSLLLITAISCKKDEEPDPNVTFTATLSGANESTPNSSTATGTATLVFNTTTKIFTLTVNHTITTPTAGHIHKAAVGVSGPVVFGFTAPVTSPISYTSPVLDATQEADLNAGLYYVNIHTAAFGAGEIRGQLVK